MNSTFPSLYGTPSWSRITYVGIERERERGGNVCIRVERSNEDRVGGGGREGRSKRRRANGDPLERRFTVKGFTNRRQVFATSADRKLCSRPLLLLHPTDRSAAVFLSRSSSFGHRFTGFPPRWRRGLLHTPLPYR